MVEENDGCHGNHLHLDAKEEEVAVDTCCHGAAAEVGENHFQSVAEVEAGYGDEQAVVEMVQDSMIYVEGDEMVEAHGDDGVEVAAVDDEGVGAALWRTVTTLCENLDRY